MIISILIVILFKQQEVAFSIETGGNTEFPLIPQFIHKQSVYPPQIAVEFKAPFFTKLESQK